MSEYYFEKSVGTLGTNKVKKIIREAGIKRNDPAVYDPAKYTYTEDGTKKVTASGTGVMATSTLEAAARDLHYGDVTVRSSL